MSNSRNTTSIKLVWSNTNEKALRKLYHRELEEKPLTIEQKVDE